MPEGERGYSQVLGHIYFKHMANVLDILVIDTYVVETLGVADASTYVGSPVSPTLSVTVPGFDPVLVPFTPNDFNVYTSITLGISLYTFYRHNTWGSMWCWIVNAIILFVCGKVIWTTYFNSS